MKIGILGGTFNPIHTGHLILAENAYEFMGLDQVLFIPSGVSYLKLVELAIASNPHFALSTIETDRKGNSYTYETLKELKAQNPDAELYFICGADVMMSIHTWKEPASILKYASLVVAPRNDTDPDLMNRRIEFSISMSDWFLLGGFIPPIIAALLNIHIWHLIKFVKNLKSQEKDHGKQK